MGSGVNGHYVQPPSKIFDKSHELASYVLAIRLYRSELEASFDLLRGKFLYVFILTSRPLSHRHFVPPICAVVFCFSLRAFRLLFHVNFGRCADRLLQSIPVLFSDLGYHTFFSNCSGRCSFPWRLLSLRFLY